MLGDIGHPLERKKIKNDKKSYSSQKIKENKKFSMKKDKMPNLKGKSINLHNLNLKSLNTLNVFEVEPMLPFFVFPTTWIFQVVILMHHLIKILNLFHQI